MLRDEKGQAFVEAAILFPIMIMIFAALVLLSIYLPSRAALQRATSFAATTIATVSSDTWLFFDEDSMSFYWEHSKDNIPNVYVALFSGMGDVQTKADKIVRDIESRNLSSKAGVLDVRCSVVNYIVYKEVVVDAVREIPIPIDLSFIGFPKTIPIAVTSSAVVQNGDEFVRNIDIAVDFIKYAVEKLGLSDIASGISEHGAKVRSILGL